MAIRIIVKEPDEVLHKKAKEVTKITPNVQK
ncbi:peptide deformylase, partial [Clostridium perfringens]